MENIVCDLLVIGAGAAGGRAAYEAKRKCAGLRVVLAMSGYAESSGSTNLVASEALGINAPFDLMADGDTADIYYDDIIATGGGLSDPQLSRIIADEAADRVGELIEMGLAFSPDRSHPLQQKLSGCTKARSLTCGGETGREITRVLIRSARQLGVELIEQILFYRLAKNRYGEICGAYGLYQGKTVLVQAKAVVLATGGSGDMFNSNVTPATQQADGWAMALDAGCRFVNMEFFQIGPAVAIPGMKFIIHSHMWRFLPRLTNANGEEFLSSYCEEGVTAAEALELKSMSYPFSVRTAAKYVDIAIFKEIMAGRGTARGGVNLDVTHIDRATFLAKAPITYAALLKAGVDLARTPLELKMAVQNFNGGVMIDSCGATGVPGLFACGEASGGVHGADRPGGNNLTDTQVFGYRSGRAAAEYAARAACGGPPQDDIACRIGLNDKETCLMREAAERFFARLTVVRAAPGLRQTLDFIDENLAADASIALRNRLLVGKLFAVAELTRKESRGTHYRDDFRATDPAWLKRLVLSKEGDNGVRVEIR